MIETSAVVGAEDWTLDASIETVLQPSIDCGRKSILPREWRVGFDACFSHSEPKVLVALPTNMLISVPSDETYCHDLLDTMEVNSSAVIGL